MSPREPGLPEGTDHIIDTNIDLGATGGGSGGSGAAPKRDSAGTKDAAGDKAAFQFDKGDDASGTAAGIIGTVKEQISSFKDQAGDKARTYADEGKTRATGLLQSVADIVADAAGSVEEKLGGQYAGVGHRASDSIQSFASRLDERSVDDLIGDARDFVQKSPMIAIGLAAVIGFAVARVVRSSVSEYRGADEGSAAGGGKNDASA